MAGIHGAVTLVSMSCTRASPHAAEKFYLLLLADYYNNTKESNEHNNYSVPFLSRHPVKRMTRSIIPALLTR